MSDLSRLSFDAFGTTSGFRSDARFSSLHPATAAEPTQASAPAFDPEPQDPVALAFAEGYAAGAAEAQAEAARQAQADAASQGLLALSFARLDKELAEELRLRLRDTVAALCETALAPMTLDEDALMRRIERAVGMLSRADDERLIRLHPEDIKLVSTRLSAEWQVVPDSGLERGSIRIEGTQGGVEDGPEQWRRAIAEALHQC